jgi:hypothetical protein
MIKSKKIWLVSFPLFKYKDDVKDLARKANLKIVDARFKSAYKPEMVIAEAEAPKLTLKPVKKAKE